MNTLRITAALFVCSTRLFSAELLLNGDFSTGLTGWSIETAGVGLGGQASVVPNLGSLTPTSSGQFALLETGPASTYGSPTPTYVALSQTFTLSMPELLTFSFRLTPITSRFTGSFATELDSFSAVVIPQAGPTVSLFSTDLSNPGFQMLPDAVVTSPSGGNYVEYLPTQFVSQQISLGAGAHTLQFLVQTDQNSFFDSGLLIEKASVTNGSITPNPVPEPGTIALLACGFGVLGLMRRTRGGNHV